MRHTIPEGLSSGCVAEETRRTRPGKLIRMRRFRFLGGVRKEPPVAIDDPRFEGWETVSTFEDQRTAVAWRDQLRTLGIDAACVADHALGRYGRGDVYLVVPP